MYSAAALHFRRPAIVPISRNLPLSACSRSPLTRWLYEVGIRIATVLRTALRLQVEQSQMLTLTESHCRTTAQLITSANGFLLCPLGLRLLDDI